MSHPENDTGQSGPVDSVRELGTTRVPVNESNIHSLTIIGQVEGHTTLPSQNKTTKYEHIMPQLVAIEENKNIDGLLVLLNTVGGDVEAGLAIAELIRSLSKPTVSIVLGGGHSIGVPIAVSAHYSFITPTATMTIHPIRLTGMVIGVPQTYEYLDKMQERVVNFVVNNSKISAERYRELMFRTGELARDVGTILVGEDAVNEGLIDAVGGISEAMNMLHRMIDEKKQALANGTTSRWQNAPNIPHHTSTAATPPLVAPYPAATNSYGHTLQSQTQPNYGPYSSTNHGPGVPYLDQPIARQGRQGQLPYSGQSGPRMM